MKHSHHHHINGKCTIIDISALEIRSHVIVHMQQIHLLMILITINMLSKLNGGLQRGYGALEVENEVLRRVYVYVGDGEYVCVMWCRSPRVFKRLWNDAEKKNRRLREIQVRRLTKKVKEDFERLNPHPTDNSSSHVDLKELHKKGASSRY